MIGIENIEKPNKFKKAPINIRKLSYDAQIMTHTLVTNTIRVTNKSYTHKYNRHLNLTVFNTFIKLALRGAGI